MPSDSLYPARAASRYSCQNKSLGSSSLSPGHNYESRPGLILERFLQDLRQPRLTPWDPLGVMFSDHLLSIAYKLGHVRNRNTLLQQYPHERMPEAVRRRRLIKRTSQPEDLRKLHPPQF